MNYDVLIIGGGHAGLEAAWISSQFNIRVAIVTLPGVGIASAPCNPAIGGVGKGQVVRELDALGGVMSKLADMSAIQYRVLNESKGFAVQSTRVQIDKDLYTENAEKLVAESNINVIRSKVSLVVHDGSCFVVTTSNSEVIKAKKVVVTTGTFLNGKMHTGSEITSGGRVNADKSDAIDSIFSNVKKLTKRFKTGTPPRIKGGTIDLSKMESQPSDSRAINFHLGNNPHYRHVEQVDCHLTRTNSNTLKTIRDNKEKSPLFNGQIQGVGPRYCPSIEDKAYRYLEKDIHHVFVEPETLSKETYYPNGLSTSLPVEIQNEFIRSVPGLENAEIAINGYAVEYDVVDTSLLSDTLEYIDVPGLYFAGQVCGTSGYEEAAGQGFIAGSNACLATLGKEKLVIDRSESYIGVMIDDLTSNVRDEPYRLFTARSENRLYIREDNSVFRMSKYREQLGINNDHDVLLSGYVEEYNVLDSMVRSIEFTNKTIDKQVKDIFNLKKVDGKEDLVSLLRKSNINPVESLSYLLDMKGLSFDERIIRNVAIDIKYDGYIKRASIENNKLHKLEKKSIDVSKLLNDENISFECRQRIERVKPSSFGQLQRLEGIRPATLAYVAANCL